MTTRRRRRFEKGGSRARNPRRPAAKNMGDEGRTTRCVARPEGTPKGGRSSFCSCPTGGGDTGLEQNPPIHDLSTQASERASAMEAQATEARVTLQSTPACTGNWATDQP